jgi:hypothetical protein
MKYLILFIPAALVFTSACKKDHTEPPPSSGFNFLEDSYFVAAEDTISLGFVVGAGNLAYDFNDSAGWNGQWSSHHF